ncbi:MAG TPA: hypothetical protein D7H86_04715 [Candidatus Poseidoniales archaeon]|nr:MAG TPA: hypothetical protein D7H86_04715 [Candidatus Poseidoniales archaeon]
MPKQWILMTNDDGVESKSLLGLGKALSEQGLGVVIFAPSDNQSATGMKLNLMKPLSFIHRADLEKEWFSNLDSVFVYSLDGSPCDTVIAALDGGLNKIIPGIRPSMLISGINLGPNLSQDVYHSGTVAAAKEAGLYGMPSIASSWASFDPEGMEIAIEATVDIVLKCLKVLDLEPPHVLERENRIGKEYLSSWPEPENKECLSSPSNSVLKAFQSGELFLNLNIPPHWNGLYKTTRLGMRWYRNAVKIGDDDSSTFTIGAATIDHTPVEKGDCDVVDQCFTSISCLPSWPQGHPLNLNPQLLAWILENTENGLPIWLH